MQTHLQRLFGHSEYRPGQREIVDAVMEGRDTLAVLPTGGGKSITYQLPAMLLPGATLVLSPLIALMKDQLENLPPDVASHTTIINSSLDSSELGRRLRLMADGRLKLVYAAPERLRQPPFLHALRQAKVSLVVVDEAHCISQWGHDFRPDYRAVGAAVQMLNPRSVLAVTATATPQVQDDIERQLGRPCHRIVRPTYRENLLLSCRHVNGEDQKMEAVLEICRATKGVVLIYTGSREKCERLSQMLKRQRISAGFYHAGLPSDERAAAQDRFMSGEVRVMAATVAFGMGVDKSDIRAIVHYNPSRSLENYYQEAGRAGRDGEHSECTLLFARADASNAMRYLRQDSMSLADLKTVYGAIRSMMTSRIGAIDLNELAARIGEAGEDLAKTALPLLEEAGLLRRYVDISRSFYVTPSYQEDVSIPEGLADFASVAGRGGTWLPEQLSQATSAPLSELEANLLTLQEAGVLTYRASQRDLLVELLPSPPGSKSIMETMLAHRGREAKHRVDAMMDYAREKRCRHAAIARYFGDTWPDIPCGSCDICLSKSERRGVSKHAAAEAPSASVSSVDLDEAPRHVLRLITDLACVRSPFAMGRAGLVRVLRGAPDALVGQGRTQAYGTLAGLKKVEVERLVDALLNEGYLHRDENDEYRRLSVTIEGRNAFNAGGKIELAWQSPAPVATLPQKGSPPLTTDADPELYEALRAWRRETATEARVPPYVIFSDKVLLALAAQQPKTEEELLAISGIGPAKAEKFGDVVLRIIQSR